MGWASGSYLCENIWKIVKDYIPEEHLETVGADICKLFVDNDADDFSFTKDSPFYWYLKKYDKDWFDEINQNNIY